MTFAESVVEVMMSIAVEISRRLTEEWKAGHLRREEYVAMMAPTFGAIELAKFLLNTQLGPLTDLRKDDLPEATSHAVGYGILLVTQFWGLREVMRNKPEVAKAIGTPHAELIRRYAAITRFGDALFKERLASIDKLTAAWDGDPRRAYDQQIIDFVHAMSVRGALFRNNLEAKLFAAEFGNVGSELMMCMQAVLDNVAMTDETEIIKALMGIAELY